MKTQISLLAAAATLVGWAVAANVSQVSAADSEKLSRFEPTGESVDCLMMRQVSSIDPVSDTTFLVKTRTGYYVNNVAGKCSDAANERNRLEYSSIKTQICKGDAIRVVDHQFGALKGTCSFGAFEKLAEKPPA